VRPGSPLQKAFALLERWINRNSDFIITSSGPTVELLVRDGIPRARVRALLDGVDTEVFAPGDGAEVRALRERLGLPGDRPIVSYLGLLNSYQGVDLLLEAAALLKGQGAKLHFLVMGFPEGGYRQKAEELGISGMVTFTGRIPYDQAPLYLSAGDLAVSPKISLTEANGKLFNYIACGLPVVVFDTPVNREILGEGALFAKYADPADLAYAIGRLAGDRELRQELGSRGRERAQSEHSWQARGRSLAGLYREMLGKK
jgi:glycosyltransferase involved in cell wall biosynthesis